MKETYYKLNREISWNIHEEVEEVMVDHLISRGILEEVQEEEVKTSAEQAIDNMFGNPLEQVDNMIEGTKEEKKCEHCNGLISVANPTFYCSHVYYPESCLVCSAKVENTHV